jgi:transposase InsO family protein
MRDAFIEEHRTTWPIAIQCRVLAVSRSGYYEWRRRPVSARAQRRASLTAQIREFHVGHHASYGSPRVHRELRARGEAVNEKNEKTVAKVMREAGIQAKSQRRFRVTTTGARLIAHSDRGVQYASEHDQGVLTQHDLECSMSRRGNCWDNAPAASFFATLKKELVHHEVDETRAAARASLFEYIEVFYNRERRHSALGYVSPLAFEEAA